MLLNFKDLFNNADYQMKRLLVNSLVDKISYDSKTKLIEIKLFCTKKKVALYCTERMHPQLLQNLY